MSSTRSKASRNPQRTPERPQRSRQQRRTKAVALGIIAVLFLGLLAATISATTGSDPDATTTPVVPTLPTSGPLSVTVPGDLDGDDKITEAEQVEVETTTTTAADLTSSTVGPAIVKTASSMLVTPSGQDWWDLVAAQTSYARLWEMPAPEGVNWYALTWNRRTTTLKGKNDVSMYPAVHIAFPNNNDAAAWAATSSNTESGASMLLDFIYRGNVVTVAPAGSDLHREPFPKRLGSITDTALDSGYWSIDYGRQIRDTIENSPARFRDAYRQFWQRLGLTTMRWSAVSRDPGRWVGKVTGFNPDKPNVEDAIGYVNATMTADGNPQASTIVMMMHVEKDGTSFGPPYMAPQEKPQDPDLVFSQMVGVHTFMVTGSSTQSSAVGYLEQWIKDGVLTIVPRPAAAPREDSAPLPPSGIPVPEGETPSPTPTIPSEPGETVTGTPPPESENETD